MPQVVAHFMDGRVVKGISMDVDPARPTFHVRQADGRSDQLRLDELKALFFVRSLVGDASRYDDEEAKPGDSRVRGSHPITVTFADDERISGLTNAYPPVKPFFFILPVDASSNNIRILVNREAVKKMASGD